MGLFYTASAKELLQIRNKIFLDFGLPALQKQGFQKSPFSTAWFGKDDLQGYSYELCRIDSGVYLQIISVLILRHSKRIKISLNIFRIEPSLDSLTQLKGLDGLKFHLMPNNKSEMELRMDDLKVPPILNYHFWFGQHKLGSYYTKSGLEKRAKELGKIIETDLNNIDNFVKRWHEIHKPLSTSWEGEPIDTH